MAVWRPPPVARMPGRAGVVVAAAGPVVGGSGQIDEPVSLL